MLKKNAIIALFALAAIALASASCAKQEVIIVPSVAYLEDLQGLGSSFPESVQETIEEINKERQFSYTVVKSKTDAELKKHARNFLKESGLVFATSYSADKALMDAATEDDESIAVCIGSNEPGSNVCRMTIRTEEASFFAGVIAAKETKTGVVAYLGGYQNAYSDPMMAGFSAGAKTVSDTIRVYTQYVLSYNSPSRAQQLIADLVEKGVDVIFADCGASIIGIEGTAKAENVKVICSDSYRYESSRTVAYLSIDIRPIVREMLGMYLDGALRKGGEYSFGLDNKVFSYDMSASKQETKDEVDIFKVIFFEFGTDLPRTQEELESFDYEYLRGVILEGVDGSVDTKEPSTEAAGSEN